MPSYYAGWGAHFNPYGVLHSMGPNQAPSYTPIGRYNGRWDRHYPERGIRSISDYPRPRAYSEWQLAGMRQQLEGDGLSGAFAWYDSMMSPAEREADWRRYW